MRGAAEYNGQLLGDMSSVKEAAKRSFRKTAEAENTIKDAMIL